MRNDRLVVERLDTPPDSLATTRAALHRIAVYVVSPARENVTGRIGLRAVTGGFATPLFGDDERQIAVVGADVVNICVDGDQRAPITTLRAAAEFADVEIDPTRADRFDVPVAGDLDEPLGVDDEASRWLGTWYAFADSILEALRGGFRADENAGIVQLWPEHFDLAVDGGIEERGQRANYGFSPGDAKIPEPYFYVGPWNAQELSGDFWGGEPWAPLRLSEFASSNNHRSAVLEFARQGRDLLRKRD